MMMTITQVLEEELGKVFAAVEAIHGLESIQCHVWGCYQWAISARPRVCADHDAGGNEE